MARIWLDSQPRDSLNSWDKVLKEENIFVIDTSRATQQDIRPLRIVVLNLMPLKITTETDLVRPVSYTHLDVYKRQVFILAHVKTIRNCYEQGKNSFGVVAECDS